MTSQSRMKNWAAQCSEPQITGSRPAIWRRVISPSVPQLGQASTAQYGSSFSPTSPAFSSTNTVPGPICSGIHSVSTFSSPTISPPPSQGLSSGVLRMSNPTGFLVAANTGPDGAHRVTQTDAQDGLARVFQDVDDLFGRGLQVQAGTVGEEVVLGAAAYGFRKAAAQVALQKTHYPANLLQRKAAPAQIGNDRDLRQVIERIEAAMTLPGGNHNALLVPPLQLPRRDTGQFDNLHRGETLFHSPAFLF